MKKLIAALCFMLAASPLALAQDKAKDAEKKAAPAKAEEKKAAPAKAEEKKAAPAKADEKKAAPAKKKAPKKEPSEKQKAQQQKMKDCTKEAGDKKLKGDDRKKFMSGCMKG